VAALWAVHVLFQLLPLHQHNEHRSPRPGPVFNPPARPVHAPPGLPAPPAATVVSGCSAMGLSAGRDSSPIPGQFPRSAATMDDGLGPSRRACQTLQRPWGWSPSARALVVPNSPPHYVVDDSPGPTCIRRCAPMPTLCRASVIVIAGSYRRGAVLDCDLHPHLGVAPDHHRLSGCDRR
jgi:hypothetical protein